MASRPDVNLSGVIDLHIHAAPDLRPRSHDDNELASQAVKAGARAIVIKSHLFPTMDRAWLARNRHPDVLVFGSITLNRTVGGINPHAVEAALLSGAKTVWLPTLDSVRHRSIQRKSGGVETVRDGRVVPELRDIFRLIAEHHAILGTGHLSPEEIAIVVHEAREQGVRKIVVTHPESYVVSMSLQEQFRLITEYEVILERCCVQPLGGGKYRLNDDVNLESIQELGHEHTILSTDSGQKGVPPWSELLYDSIEQLHASGISRDALRMMTKTVPAQLLDLPLEDETAISSIRGRT